MGAWNEDAHVCIHTFMYTCIYVVVYQFLCDGPLSYEV